MASFIAKQMVGNQLKSVKGAMGGDDEKKDEGGADDGEDPEVAEARREAEEKRKEKHRKMEEEREELRQSIRDKYGLKKKVPEEEGMMQPPEEAGRIGRKKKTPAELAAEANADSDDEDFAKLPGNLGEITSKVTELPSKLAQGVGEKCALQ
ncbi:complexin-like [Ruditapes philippinarum]|uniref:complexin-like n=1 Tax=Ruditapes philippinarum TaxID=129788 RepID=UPI00295B7E9D|nr:complexin-like [Ruditapes philippinarum]XP_060585430.1 complexin-like [Ruditapes philippinarum]